jgi:hypothetical protein
MKIENYTSLIKDITFEFIFSVNNFKILHLSFEIHILNLFNVYMYLDVNVFHHVML